MVHQPTRRRFLTVTATLGASALAGCASLGGGTEPTEPATEGSMNDGMDDSMTATTAGTMDDGMTEEGMMATAFTVTVENVSTAETLQTMDGPKPVPLAPVAYVLHETPGVLFEEGSAASAGLEQLAEDGSPEKLVEELAMDEFHAGAQAVPMGADDPGPIGPGDAYEYSVEAHEGQHLSLATMFVQSNDLFYAPPPAGIPLWTEGEPVDGEFTEQLELWDAGTEVNQEPGAGTDQAPRQDDMDTGEAEDDVVRQISDVDDGYQYPATTDVIKLTISPGGMDG